MMTWFDFALVLFVAAMSVVGVKRKLTGLLVGAASLVLMRILLVIFSRSVFIGLVFALVAGVLLGFAGRSFIQRKRGPSLPSGIMGGVGGFVLGTMLVILTVTSLPIERNLNNQIVYPPSRVPFGMRNAVTQSQFVGLGRDILLYPLLVNDEIIEPNGVLSGLHHFFVVGDPWERRF